ncbi:MAG: DEAD/DEAH box helicase [Phycisphaerales bacterium]|nr:DEAD/DEAH box helicase [Phycisphaerales bacterium]NUQ67604.1 DEAD/DEAH box helicase [Phycisphaerales bacterium]
MTQQPENPDAAFPTPPDAFPPPPPEGSETRVEAGKELFDTHKTFTELGLRSSVLKGVTEAGFLHPTLIQASLIPLALSGRDVLGQAKTGTGKTAAFGLPLLHMCDKDTPYQALVLAPTRELAVQITEELDELGKHTPIRATTVMGGESVRGQAKELERGSHIVVGTPGRVQDMLERGHFHLKNIRFAVLDEVDRMLDIGFREDIRRILDQCPRERQTMFVSATISRDIESLARKYLRNPEKLVVASGSLTVSLVEQHYLTVNPWDKRALLAHLLTHEEPALTLVFCRLKRTVDDLTKLLNARGIEAHAIHGDMPQGKRTKTMQKLRSGHLSVLVCSDLASRGIDADGVTHVINYDLPEDPEIYVHRIGRTARAGRRGTAWSFVTGEQGHLLTQIEMLINTEIPKLDYSDFTPTPKPNTWRDEVPSHVAVIEGVPEKKPPVDRLTAAANPDLPTPGDETKFPGGLVPTKLPPRLLNRKLPSGRR